MSPPRAHASQYARRVNRAIAWLAEGTPPAEAARRLAEHFEVSQRQAWRYVREAGARTEPLNEVPRKVVFTVKVPEGLVERVRAMATHHGRTLSSVVSEALDEWLRRRNPHRPGGG